MFWNYYQTGQVWILPTLEKTVSFVCILFSVFNITGLAGATVKLQCNNTRYPIEAQGKTDKNGYFYIEAPKTITNYGAHKCKVFLVSSGLATCPKPSNLHGGYTGAVLKPEKAFVSKKLPFVLFSVGPLAFNPKC